MNYPKTSAEAAELVIEKAEKEHVAVSVYCQRRGVNPSVITRWKTRNMSFTMSTFLRLIESPSA